MIVQSAPPVFRFRQIRQPMAWAAAAHASGIIAGAYLWRPMLWWFIAAAAFLGSAAYFARRRAPFGWSLAFAAFFLTGAFSVQVRKVAPRLDTSIQPYADGQRLEITAHVTRDGRVQTGAYGEIRQLVDVEIEQIETAEGKVLPVHSGIRLGIYARQRNSEVPGEDPSADMTEGGRAYGYGDRIRFSAKLKLPRNFRNPGAFDYQGYLAERGIAALGSAKADDVALLPGFAGTRFGSWRSRLHRAIVAKVHQLWPSREAALIDAMVIGEDAFIERDTRADFQRSGSYHVLVVSGMTVSILAFVVFWTLRRLRFSDVPATLMTVLFCVAYAFVTEVGAPVWRATLMCAIYLVTRLLYRDRSMINTLGAAALGLLIFDPRQLFTASFQMTFLCVLLVSAIGVPILQRTTQLYRLALMNWDSRDYASVLPPHVAQFRVDLQLIAARLARFVGKKPSRWLISGAAGFAFFVWELLFMSAVMQMGLALPMAFYFHRVTTVGLPANLLVVPLMQVLMPAAVAALSLSYISPWLAKFPVAITALAINGIAGSVHTLGALHLAELRVPTPSPFMITAATAALGTAIWTARRRPAATTCGLAAMFATLLLLAAVPPRPRVRPGMLEMTSIDVGEGDSELVVTPEGRSLLVDAGGPIGPGGSQLDFGEDVVSPYLWTRGISRLDAVAITHGHSDHIGGMIAVLRNFRPKELWVGLLPPSRALDDVIAVASQLGVKVVRHWEGDEFNFGGANVKVLFPPRDLPPGAKPQNNDSMVMHVSYRQSSVLLEGDAERAVERRVAALHHPSASLLKVGHHGSANATTPELVASARPQFAVVSVGSGNSFGLPRIETLARLAEAGVRVYRTDLNGAVTFYLDGRSVTASVGVLP